MHINEPGLLYADNLGQSPEYFAELLDPRVDRNREQLLERIEIRRDCAATAVFAALGMAAATAVLGWAAWKAWRCRSKDIGRAASGATRFAADTTARRPQTSRVATDF